MKILAFDTTNNNHDIVLMFDNKIVASQNSSGVSNQAEMLVPKIEECLNKANIWYNDLDLIATTKGPGNFAGIRIGFSVAKTIKLAAKVPFVGVNNLEALAYDYLNHQGSILVVMDAKLEEFFIQEFTVISGALIPKYKEPKLIKYEDINSYLPQEKYLVVGSGKTIAKEIIQDKSRFDVSDKEDFIKSSNIAMLAQEIYDKNEGLDNEILYVRKVNISKPKS